MKEWFYLGCHTGHQGHYLYTQRMKSYGYERKFTGLMRFDGTLPPQNDPTPYVATVSRLEGWEYSALAFWDYSVDTRPGSNSIVFAPSLSIDPVELLLQAKDRFSEVFNRFTQPIQLFKGQLCLV